MSILINLMCPCWVNINFRVIPCLPNHCIRAPLRHISPIVLPDAVYQKLNYSLFIACFSLLGSCETHKMPALYALTQHQCSDITTLVWKPLHYQSDELQRAESTVSHSMTQSAASLAVTAEPNEYFTFPRFSVVNTDINFSVLIRFGWFEWIFFPPEQLFLGPSTFRGQDAIWFLLTRTPADSTFRRQTERPCHRRGQTTQSGRSQGVTAVRETCEVIPSKRREKQAVERIVHPKKTCSSKPMWLVEHKRTDLKCFRFSKCMLFIFN